MSWPYTLTRALVAAFLMLASVAGAQSLETAIMPGPTIQGHADLEARCDNCHVRFDRAAQTRLCLDCHKPVKADVAAGTGYHGRLKEGERQCRACHTDHKGRGVKIVVFDEKKFDHGQTDFPLRGKHRLKACASCHRPGAKYRQAASDCVACHRKDDKHKDGLGAKCGNCHGEETWKDGRFDHAKTKFPLRRAHADGKIKCEDCHRDHKYVDTARDCASCHRDDDMKSGHKGHFGPRCEKCHDEGEWKAAFFRHDRDTHYSLTDRHRLVKCENCHRTPLFREATPTRCVACHRNDDVHKNALTDKCDKCHNTKGWKGTRFDHDLDSRFPLRDKHKAAKCESCHQDKGMREKLAMKCVACHERDDREKGHQGNYGDKCESCHNEKAFKPALFDHGRDTPFELAGKHAKGRCDACHNGPLYTKKIESRCYACHEKEDVHFATYGLDCDRCHVADDWRKVKKDADKASLPPRQAPP